MPTASTAFHPYLTYSDIFARRVSSDIINMNRNRERGANGHARSNTNSNYDNNNDNGSRNNSTVAETPQRRRKISDALPSPFPPIKHTVNGTAIIDNDEMSDSVLSDVSVFEMVRTPCSTKFANKFNNLTNKIKKQNEVQTQEAAKKESSANSNSVSIITNTNHNENMQTLERSQNLPSEENTNNRNCSNRSVTTNTDHNVRNSVTNTLPQITATSSTSFSSFPQQQQQEESRQQLQDQENVVNSSTSLSLPHIVEEHNNSTVAHDSNERITSMQTTNNNIDNNEEGHLESTENNVISSNNNNNSSTNDNHLVSISVESTVVTSTKGSKRNLFTKLLNWCSHSRKQQEEEHDESYRSVEPVTKCKKVHKILNVLDGGYVVFTDNYLHTHPDSSIADLSFAYQEHAHSLLHSDNDTTPHTNNYSRNSNTNISTHSSSAERLSENAMLHDQRSCLQRVRKCIDDVQHERRPLFRRRNSDVVYGRAMYISTSGNNNNNQENEETIINETDEQNEASSSIYCLP